MPAEEQSPTLPQNPDKTPEVKRVRVEDIKVGDTINWSGITYSITQLPDQNPGGKFYYAMQNVDGTLSPYWLSHSPEEMKAWMGEEAEITSAGKLDTGGRENVAAGTRTNIPPPPLPPPMRDVEEMLASGTVKKIGKEGWEETGKQTGEKKEDEPTTRKLPPDAAMQDFMEEKTREEALAAEHPEEVPPVDVAETRRQTGDLAGSEETQPVVRGMFSFDDFVALERMQMTEAEADAWDEEKQKNAHAAYQKLFIKRGGVIRHRLLDLLEEEQGAGESEIAREIGISETKPFEPDIIKDAFASALGDQLSFITIKNFSARGREDQIFADLETVDPDSALGIVLENTDTGIVGKITILSTGPGIAEPLRKAINNALSQIILKIKNKIEQDEGIDVENIKIKDGKFEVTLKESAPQLSERTRQCIARQVTLWTNAWRDLKHEKDKADARKRIAMLEDEEGDGPIRYFEEALRPENAADDEERAEFKQALGDLRAYPEKLAQFNVREQARLEREEQEREKAEIERMAALARAVEAKKIAELETQARELEQSNIQKAAGLKALNERLTRLRFLLQGAQIAAARGALSNPVQSPPEAPQGDTVGENLPVAPTTTPTSVIEDEVPQVISPGEEKREIVENAVSPEQDKRIGKAELENKIRNIIELDPHAIVQKVEAKGNGQRIELTIQLRVFGRMIGAEVDLAEANGRVVASDPRIDIGVNDESLKEKFNREVKVYFEDIDDKLRGALGKGKDSKIKGFKIRNGKLRILFGEGEVVGPVRQTFVQTPASKTEVIPPPVDAPVLSGEGRRKIIANSLLQGETVNKVLADVTEDVIKAYETLLTNRQEEEKLRQELGTIEVNNEDNSENAKRIAEIHEKLKLIEHSLSELQTKIEEQKALLAAAEEGKQENTKDKGENEQDPNKELIGAIKDLTTEVAKSLKELRETFKQGGTKKETEIRHEEPPVSPTNTPTSERLAQIREREKEIALEMAIIERMLARKAQEKAAAAQAAPTGPRVGLVTPPAEPRVTVKPVRPEPRREVSRPVAKETTTSPLSQMSKEQEEEMWRRIKEDEEEHLRNRRRDLINNPLTDSERATMRKRDKWKNKYS